MIVVLPVACSNILKDYHFNIFSLLPQTEIAKRLNAILAQIMPFLSQEVSVTAARSILRVRIISFTMHSNCTGNLEAGYYAAESMGCIGMTRRLV